MNHYEGVDEGESINSLTKRSAKRNIKKYAFNNQSYGKGRLVLAVVKEYVVDHPKTSFVELASVFPKELQGSSGVFVEQAVAEDVFERAGHKRHFIKPDELIKLDNIKIAVSTEWSVENIDKIIEKAETLGYLITEED